MNYEFSTPEATYELAVNPSNTDNVFVYAEHKEDLETVVNSLELAGVQDGRYFEDLIIEDTELPESAQRIHFIEITRADLALYLQFEVLNYLGYDSMTV